MKNLRNFFCEINREWMQKPKLQAYVPTATERELLEAAKEEIER